MNLYQLIICNFLYYIIWLSVASPIGAFLSTDNSIPGSFMQTFTDTRIIIATIFLIASYIEFFAILKKKKRTN